MNGNALLPQHQTHEGVSTETDLQTPDCDDDAIDIAIPEVFKIDSPEAAAWVVRKINEARAYKESVENWAMRERRRADREEAFFLARFGGELRLWTSAEVAKLGGRRRSLCLPSGTVGFRRGKALLVIEDAVALLRWAKAACPKAVVMTETVVKAVINEHFQASGEVPEGVRLQPDEDRFYVS